MCAIKMQKSALLVVPLVLLSALAGIWTGWYRIGWIDMQHSAAGEHGLLMVGSFLGTLISLERAVATGNRCVMAIPFLNGLSLGAFLLGYREVGYHLLTLGSLGYAGIMAYFLFRFSELYFYVLFGAAVCAFIGNIVLILWGLYPVAVPWWIAFLLLTITAERLELSKFLPFGRLKKNLLFAALALFVAGLLLPFHGLGGILTGLGMAAIAAWLLTYDMARKSVGKPGIHGYTGLLLLCGYGWLLLSGLLMAFGEPVGFMYDAALHSFFVGFVFLMVFAHGPIIIPGILGAPIKPFRKGLYAWFVLLTVSLAVRLGADLLFMVETRQWAGLVNGLTILGFFVNMGTLVVLEMRKLKARNRLANVA
jgi:hypothetical protein